MEQQNLILDISEEQFNENVIEQSSSFLILVDFWAPWCGPCKQLTPLLEKIIKKSENKVKLMKINIDENQQIAGQLKIQSIPAVFAFKDKKVVDAFQGVIPESKIIEFIEKNLGGKISRDNSEFYETIELKIKEENFLSAKESLEEFLAENSEDKKAIALYLSCLTNLNLINEARSFVESLEKDIKESKEILSAIKNIDIKNKNIDGPSLENLREKYEIEPKNIDVIIKLSEKLFSDNLIDEAFLLLLDNFKLDSKKLKITMLEFFTALGNNNETTIKYRKKLSSIIFS